MQATMDLLAKALDRKHASAWARDFNLDRSTFSQAKKHGRLSPMLAGNIAIELGEDPEHWIAIAALEAAQNDKDLALLTRLKERHKPWRRL